MARSMVLACALALATTRAEGLTVVAGATGRTGVLIFNGLKAQGQEVRAVVRNVSKARQYLGCDKCDASEGIFVVDISKAGPYGNASAVDTQQLVAAVSGATTLIVATSSVPICDPYPNCSFPAGGLPVDVDWNGGRNLVTAIAQHGYYGRQNKVGSTDRDRVVLISTMGTTEPEDPSQPGLPGHISFYKLNLETWLATSGLGYAIIKPCGLINAAGSNSSLFTSHDDTVFPNPPTIPRADVARVVNAAATLSSPDHLLQLRFDLCSRAGQPTEDLDALLASALWQWEPQSTQLPGVLPFSV